MKNLKAIEYRQSGREYAVDLFEEDGFLLFRIEHPVAYPGRPSVFTLKEWKRGRTDSSASFAHEKAELMAVIKEKGYCLAETTVIAL